MDVLRRYDSAEVFTVGRKDLQTAGSGNVQVTFGVDLDPVDRVFALEEGEIKEEPAVLYRAVRLDLVAVHDLFLLIPVADVQVFFVG